MNILICDDDNRIRSETKLLVEKWLKACAVTAEITLFDNGDSLLVFLEKHKADLLLLDIMMPLLNGMEVAHIIRDRRLNIKLVFLTSSPEFAVESYDVKASGYLLKPVDYDKLKKLLDEQLLTKNDEPARLSVKTRVGFCNLSLHGIEFMEAQKKNVVFHLADGTTVEALGGFSTYEESLTEKDGFFKCHRSFIVNLKHIRTFSGTEIQTDGGEICPIARGFAAPLKDAYFKLMFPEE